MYYKSIIEGTIRVDPSRFSEKLKTVILEELKENIYNHIFQLYF